MAGVAWCLNESEIGIYEGSMLRAMCGVQLKDRKRYTDLLFILDLKKTVDQLAMANSVHWYGHVLSREDGHILRRAFDFEREGQGKKGRPKRLLKKQVEEERLKVGLRRKDAVCSSQWSVNVTKISAGLR